MIQVKKISTNQLLCLIAMNQIGVHVLSIPYEQSKYSGYDSWIAVLLGGVYAQLIILIIYALGKRYPNEPIQQYICKIVGKPLGKLLIILFSLYFIESLLTEAVTYADVISRWVLFETPWSAILGLFFLVSVYAASCSFRTISTVTQLILVMFVFCALIIIVCGVGKGTFLHFLPIGSHGIGAIVKDSRPSFLTYAGYDVLLYAFPFVVCQKKKEILVASSIANLITTIFYVMLAIIVTYNFSENQLKTISEPMIFILRKFSMPVLHNIDIVFITIWISVVLATVFIYLFIYLWRRNFFPASDKKK
ncbi:GerAB/ArcD/ProY family transporter [Bacillus sp. AFS002410]|uniref:GerAB/ArcD/ProY family transporter n=1 Tax=Bacillus sp. AFS002410 TaxID=2033481 RepID=UPI00211D7CA9|nr:spore germination protein [Bacillus sp. AFS002410]